MPPTPSVPSPVSAPLRFGPSQRFELQPAEGRLLVDGRPAALGRRAFDLLLVLAERPDRLQTKHELVGRVWPGLVVEEANLQVQISNLRKVLGGDVISTVPGRGYRFAPVVSVGEPAAVAAGGLTAPARAAPGSTAPAHRLIGRDQDLAQLLALLQAGCSVTLVGAAGVGKTSLARVAVARWPGPSAWVDLAPLAQGAQVADALARALELQLSGGPDEAPAQLVDALRRQPLLLVLDNAEHLLEACADWFARLAPLPGVQLLVTSQATLAVAGEQVLRLAPLPLPAPDAASPSGELPPPGALTLLVDRIVAADLRFVPTAAQQPLLHALCAQLDGLPLAIEMAAARVPLLGLQGVHDALTERFALLTRGHRDAASRHRTLRNALAWSYGLLAPAEQRLFRALGVFAGGFTLELAVALMTDEPEARWDVIDGLATLADRSLVVVGDEDPPRYRLLETMQAFALQMAAEGDASGAEPMHFSRRHAAAVLALFSRYTSGNVAVEALCLAEMANARQALGWAREHDLGLAAQLSAAVTPVTTFSTWRQESGNWLLALEPLLDSPAGEALPRVVQAQWWMERARIGAIRRHGDAPIAGQRAVALWRLLAQPRRLLTAMLTWVRCFTEAGPGLDAACAQLQALADSMPELPLRSRYAVLGALTWAALMRGDRVAVLAGRQAEVALARQLGDPHALNTAESNLVAALSSLGRHAEALALGQVLLARVDADGRGSDGNLPWVLSTLLGTLVALGRLDEARSLLPRVAAAGRRFQATAMLMLPLCALAVAQRRFEAAAQLLGFAREGHAVRRVSIDPDDEEILANVLAAVTAALGPERTEALRQQGARLSDEDAEALAAAG